MFVNQSPSIQEIPNQTINEDSELVVSLDISDPEEDALTIDVQSDQEAVQGMVEESNLSITLDEDWYGSAQITVSVSDGEFTVETDFELTVSPVNDMPGEFALISPSDNSTVTITSDNLGELLQFEWEESIDVDGDELTYTFSGYNDLIFLTFPETGELELTITYSDLATLMQTAGVNNVTGNWTVAVQDSEYTVLPSSGEWTLTLDVSSLSTVDGLQVPDNFALHQNYPNPFNPVTTLHYDLPEQSLVSIMIYDILGREIIELVHNVQDAGFKSIQWDATNDAGNPVNAGVYIYQIHAGNFVQIRKMVLVK